MPSGDELKEIAERFGIREMYVFGSRAAEIASRVRRQQVLSGMPTSDVDIGLNLESDRLLTIAEKKQFVIIL